MGKAKATKAPDHPLEHRILLTVTMCLLAAGAVMVYSASSARDLLAGGGDGTGYLLRYVGFGALGVVLMLVLSRRGLDTVRKATPLLLAISFVLLLAVLLPGIGVEVNGAKRWIGAGAVGFQPSELAKFALVLYAAELLGSKRRIRSIRSAAPVTVVAGVMAMLVAVEPDLGTALVIAATTTALLVAAGVPLKHLAAAACIAVALIAIFALLEPYRRARLTTFLDPWAHAGGAGFQSVQGQIALGSGGLFGVGLGQSVQKIFYLPEAHTDFVLAVIGEEFGVLGVSVVLALYGMLAWAGMRAARAAKGAYAKLLAAGMTSLILCQAALNVFAVLGLAPLTGVPLPFISYGPSNLIVLLAAMGLLLNIAAGGSAHMRVLGAGRRAKSRAGGSSESGSASASRARRAGTGRP
ncbi:MAG: putative lipid II flippase FtsW [Solirubrobacterales bacterium]